MKRSMTPLALLLASLPFATLGCDSKGSDAAATTGAVAEVKPVESSAPAPADTTVPAAASATAAPAAPADTAAAAAPDKAGEPAAPDKAGEPAAPKATGDAKAAASPASTGDAKAAASPASTGDAKAGPKTFDCGAKGQKLCPMQAWMKSTMAAASSSGDGEKLAKALLYVAGKPPPGMGNWGAMSRAAAAKAKAGDIDGAKASCKQCHDAYKEQYKKTMRDRPW